MLLETDNVRVSVRAGWAEGIDEGNAHGASNDDTPKPDSFPLTVILPADMFAAVVFGW